jgi:hypothetical protein
MTTLPTWTSRVSPLGEAPPPILRPDRPAAGALLPVARRGLNPYLFRCELPPESHRLPPGYPLSRAVALASGDNSVHPDLLPRLRTVLNETRVGNGLYIRDVVNIALDERADSRPTPCPAGPSGDPPGLRTPRGRRPPRLGPAPALPGPNLPAAAPRDLPPLPLPLSAPSPGPPSRASPLSSIGDFSVELNNSGSDSDATSFAASDGTSPTPPGDTPYSSPSPIPARRPPRRSPSPARHPAARATLFGRCGPGTPILRRLRTRTPLCAPFRLSWSSDPRLRGPHPLWGVEWPMPK